MTLRLANFNVEDLFEAPRRSTPPHGAQSQPALQAFERFNVLAKDLSTPRLTSRQC